MTRVGAFMSDKYFWQLVFIKYTQDNKRVFYPNFFSDGYFITSEEQMINYRKFGNKFFIVSLFVFYLMLKLKIFKLLYKMHFLNFWYVLIVIGIILLVGIIYNIVAEKNIFRHSPKIEEKYWVNNEENAKFLLQTAGNFILFILLLGGIVYLCIRLIHEWYYAIAAIIGIILVCWFYDNKQKEKISEFVLTLEYEALYSYSEDIMNRLNQETFSDKSNQCKIIENIKEYLPVLLEHFITTCNYTYENEILNINKYINEFKAFNEELYNSDVPEEEHIKIIEERFLPDFECVNSQ